MWDDTYCVEVDGEVVARGLDLKIATILVRALFEEYWNDKYMCIYPATSSYSNSVYSLKPVEDPEDIGADEFTHFEYMTSYNDCPVCSAVIMLQDTRLDEEEEMPRVFGAATEFISLDCSASDEIENDSYCIAHFYEK